MSRNRSRASQSCHYHRVDRRHWKIDGVGDGLRVSMSVVMTSRMDGKRTVYLRRTCHEWIGLVMILFHLHGLALAMVKVLEVALAETLMKHGTAVVEETTGVTEQGVTTHGLWRRTTTAATPDLTAVVTPPPEVRSVLSHTRWRTDRTLVLLDLIVCASCHCLHSNARNAMNDLGFLALWISLRDQVRLSPSLTLLLLLPNLHSHLCRRYTPSLPLCLLPNALRPTLHPPHISTVSNPHTRIAEAVCFQKEKRPSTG